MAKMARSNSVESELSSSLSGPPSDAEMGGPSAGTSSRNRRVLKDDDDTVADSLRPSRAAATRARYSDGEPEDDDDGEEDAEGEDDEEDDELLDDDDGEEEANGSDVDELEDEEDEPSAAPVNAKTGRKITLRIGQNAKQANGAGKTAKATARAGKGGSSRSKKGQAADDDEEESFEEFENEDIFASLPKTARQLAKERADQGTGSPGSELLELPPEESKKARMTESELALKRSELARRRRNQSEKKLEDDKIETINRLLKKQVSRTGGRSKKPTGSDAEDDEEVAKEGSAERSVEHKPTPQELKDRPAPYFRYISSIRDGQAVRSSLSLPIEVVGGETDGTSQGPYKRKWDEMFGQQQGAPVAAGAPH